jgi:hypothetical protein
MSLQSVGLYWQEEKGWTISSDEGVSHIRGLIKSVKIIIGPQDLQKRKMIDPIPMQDALGSALIKTDRSIIMVKSKHSNFLINSSSFLKMFSHKGGRIACVGGEEFPLNGAEVTMIDMVIEEQDFDMSDTETVVSSARSVKFAPQNKSIKSQRKRNKNKDAGSKYEKVIRYLASS